jgi:hypothetical protein
MWDNRLTKKNPKQPDFKCRDKNCDGVVWPPRDGRVSQGDRDTRRAAVPRQGIDMPPVGHPPMPFDEPPPYRDEDAPEVPQNPAAEKLRAIFRLQEVCFTHAIRLAAKAEASGISVTLEGVSALTAQSMIEANRRGV